MAKAHRFEHTPQFKHAISRVFEDQPPARQQQIVKVANQHPEHPTSRAILQHVAQRSQEAHAPDTHVGQDIAKAEHFKATAPPIERKKYMSLLGAKFFQGKDYTNEFTGQTANKADLVSGLALAGLKDAYNIPANAIPSMYEVGKTAVTDSPVKAGKMLAQPYVDFVNDPVGSFKAHPGGTALLFAGLEGGIGRAAGRVGRLAPEGSAIERAASTSRTSATLPGTSLTETRRYSPDIFTKAVQVAKEHSAVRRSERLHAEADRAEHAGDPETARALRMEAHKANPLRMGDQQVGRRMTERVDANEKVRSMHRANVVGQADKIMGRKPTAALSLVTQGIARATPKDLLAYRDELAAQYPHLTRVTEQTANLKLRRDIEDATKGKGALDDVQRQASEYEQLVAPRQQGLADAGMLAQGQIDMAKLVPYAVRNMGARFDLKTAKLLDHEGNVLTPQAIKAHMDEAGVPSPAYVTQAPGKGGSGNYYVDPNRPQNIATGTRTGEATLKGSFDASPETLREGAARMQGLLDAHKGFAETINEFGLRDKGGPVKSFDNRGDAVAAGRELAARGEGEWRPVRMQPFAGKQAQLHDLLERTHSEHQPEHENIRSAIESAIKGSEGPGPWGLIPEAGAKTLDQHMRVLGSGGAGKAFQLANSQFRKTVLSTSPKWLVGNDAEAALRAAIDRAGPRSWYTMHGIVRRLANEPETRGRLSKAGDKVFGPYQGLNPEAADELMGRAFGGGHFTMADRSPRRSAEQFQGTRLEPVANALHTFWSTPGPKQAAQLWHHYTNFVFHKLNEPMERQFQMAMGGAHVRRNLMDNHMVKTSQRAISDAANGLTETHAQVELARQIDRAYGRYSKMGPTERRIVQLYTPFIAWTRNALHFTLHVLPRDHPVLTSAIAAASLSTEQWRKGHGLDLFMKGRAPDFLQGSIPEGSDRRLRVSRYTPFGLYGDLLGNVGNSVLPQFSGVLAATQGQDWKGKPLKGPGGDPPTQNDKAKAAAQALVEATVPLVGQITQMVNGTGSVVQRARKVYDPLAATSGKPKKKTKKSSAPFDFKSAGQGAVSTSGGFDFHTAK